MNRELFRSKKYMQWIREQPCCVTGSHRNVVAHHVTVWSGRGMSQKPCDFWCVPLTNELHQDLHQHGEKSFWNHNKLNPHRMITKYQREFISMMTDQSFELAIQLSDFISKIDKVVD